MSSVVRVVVLLWVGLLVGCNSFAVLDVEGNQAVDSATDPSSNSNSSPNSTPTVGPSSESDSSASDSIPTKNSGVDVVASESQDSRLGDSLETGTIRNEPHIGDFTFALDVTEDYKPIDPGFFFTHGITKVHAIFEYNGMSPGSSWERVWYLNDKEVVRITESWVAPESGVFNYFIDNGGRPLPAGDWVLELYVEGKLQALGVFVIER